MNLSKKKALVTGASKRVGLKIAEHLIQNGYSVVIHSSKPVAQKSDKFEYVTSDFRDPNQVELLLSELQDVDLLINNASFFSKDDFSTISIENLQNSFSVNLFTPLILTAKLKNLKNVINILDSSTDKNDDYFLSYKLAKRSLTDLTKIAANALNKKQCRANGIALGFIETPSGVSDHVYQKLLSETPLGIETKISELLTCIDTILSCESMTGNVIYLDSGVCA